MKKTGLSLLMAAAADSGRRYSSWDDKLSSEQRKELAEFREEYFKMAEHDRPSVRAVRDVVCSHFGINVCKESIRSWLHDSSMTQSNKRQKQSSELAVRAVPKSRRSKS